MCRVHHEKCWSGWITSWNQDFWEKYKQPQICRWYLSNGRKWRGISLLVRVTKASEKAVLKINIQNAKITASGAVTSWQIKVGYLETVTDYLLLGSKITTDGNCSHEIKRPMLLGRKIMTNLDGKWERRKVPLLIKFQIVSQKYGFFPIVKYRCESWTIKKAMCWIMDAFQLWWWRNLESPLDCKEFKPVIPKGNQPWLFFGRTDAEAPILWPVDAKSQLTGKDSNAGKNWRQKEKGWQRMR